MSWRKVADLSVVVGKYQKDGQEKNRYMNCGIVLKDENNRSCIKLTCLPFKEDGSLATFLNIYPIDKKEEPKPPPQQQQKRDEFDDDIPF